MTQMSAFDSLEDVQSLEAAGVPRQQAEAQAKALRKIDDERLVTREYFDFKMRELEYSLVIKIGSMIIGSVAVIAALRKILK